MADAVQERIELQIDELHDLYRRQIFTREEIRFVNEFIYSIVRALCAEPCQWNVVLHAQARIAVYVSRVGFVQGHCQAAPCV